MMNVWPLVLLFQPCATHHDVGGWPAGMAVPISDSITAVTGGKRSSPLLIIILEGGRVFQRKAAPWVLAQPRTSKASTKVQQLMSFGGARGSETPGIA